MAPAPSPWPARLKGLGQTAVNILFLVAAGVGLVQLMGAVSGQVTVQPFRSLAAFRPEWMPLRTQCLTRSLKNSDSAEAHWQALQPARQLAWAINPDIATWLDRLNREERITWSQQPTLFNWPVVASYVWYADTFYLGPGFWKLREGEKAAVLAHEYFHAQQNKWAMVGDTLLETLSGQLPEYGSRTEDEAHLYQWFALRALDLPPTSIRGYFMRRSLYRFILSQPIPNPD
jgi:hypothetical protein